MRWGRGDRKKTKEFVRFVQGRSSGNVTDNGDRPYVKGV